MASNRVYCARFTCVRAAGKGYLGQRVIWTGLEVYRACYELSLIEVHFFNTFCKIFDPSTSLEERLVHFLSSNVRINRVTAQFTL